MIKLMVFACFCRTAEDETRRAKEEKNKISKAVGAKKKADKKADISAEQAQSKALDESIKVQEVKYKELETQTNALLGKIGNIVHSAVPISQNEDNNIVVRTWG